MYVLLLNQELPNTNISALLGSLFGIEPYEVATILAEEPRQVNFDTQSLERSSFPREEAEASSFFFELCVFPHGRQMQSRYENEHAFATALSQASQLPVLIQESPYHWLLLAGDKRYDVSEWPEDEHTQAVTVTQESKQQRL